MSELEVLDPRFGKLVIGHAKLERLWTGARWVEGPAYFPAGRYLVFSDIPNDRLMRYDETSGVGERRMSIIPPQAGQRMKCSASSLGGPPMRSMSA